MKESLQSLLPQLDAASKEIPTNASTSPYSCLVGPTGAGKSSIICYSIDYDEMTFSKKAGKYDLKAGSSRKMPQIGNTCGSQTDRATFYQKDDLKFVDLPGIFDTKGCQQQIVNAYSNSLVFKKGMTLKLIIVLEVSSLYDKRGGLFADIIVRLEQLFGPDFPQLANSSCFLISKLESLQYSEEDVIGTIQEIISSSSYLPLGSVRRNFAQAILKNKKLLFFPVPKDMTSLKMEEIKNSFKAIPNFQLKHDSKVSLSEEAKTFLSKEVHQKQAQMRQLVDAIVRKIQTKYQKPHTTIPNANAAQASLAKALTLKKHTTADPLGFPLQQFAQHLAIDLSEVNAIAKHLEELKQLAVVFPEATKNYQSLLVTLFTVIEASKNIIQNEITNINSRLQRERVQREHQAAQARQAEAQRIQLQQQRLAAKREAERVQAERVRVANQQAAARQAQADRIQRVQNEQMARVQQAIRQQQIRVANAPRPRRRRGGCEIM